MKAINMKVVDIFQVICYMIQWPTICTKTITGNNQVCYLYNEEN